MSSLEDIKIVGAGLIGTSIALRLVELGHKVLISDQSASNQALARDLLGSAALQEDREFSLIVIATPIGSVVEVAVKESESNPSATIIDVSGLMTKVLVEIEKFSDIARRFVSTHPMAGRELSGPQSARSDLFESRPWLISTTSSTSQESLESALSLARKMGSIPFEIDRSKHDAAMAAISQVPQILSSALGVSLNSVPESALQLAGQGLRDVSRLAESSPLIWSDLLTANSQILLPLLREVTDSLEKLTTAISHEDVKSINEFFLSAKSGRAKIPGKHGGLKRDYAYLPIVIEDKPGQLGALFEDCAKADVNIEDLLIEHSPGQETGLITLAVNQSDAIGLTNFLQSNGWKVHQAR